MPMCYTCGCSEPEDSHGDRTQITEKSFEDAADARNISTRQAKENAVTMLQRTLASNNTTNTR